MQNTKNDFYNLNKQRIEIMKKGLVEMVFRNEHEEVPIKQIIHYIDSLVLEICKLQKDKDELVEKLNDSKKG